MTPAAVARVGGNVEVVGMGQPNASDFYYDGWVWSQSGGLVDLSSVLSTLSGIPNGGLSPTGSTIGSGATGINASGQIVGTYGYNSAGGDGGTGSNSHYGGFSYTIGSSALDMKCAGTSFQGVGTVNSSGQVAVTLAEGISLTFPAGIAYANGTTACTNIGAGANGTVYANCINDSGMIGGDGAMANTYNEFGVYSGGAWHDLGELVAGKPLASLKGIDATGDVVGSSRNASNKVMPVYVSYTGSNTWGSFVNLFTAGSNSNGTFATGYAYGFDGAGDIVGYESSTKSTTAFIWTTPSAASGVPLSSLVTNVGSWNLEAATAADSSGDIVGYGLNSAGNLDAFLLTPTVTPEPSPCCWPQAWLACWPMPGGSEGRRY